MTISSVQHGFRETGKFSSLILDYLEDLPALRDFHAGRPSVATIREAIERRRNFSTDRKNLYESLCTQYESVEVTARVRDQLDALQKENTYTITTAHQCNVFLGPLYTIFKTLHTIRIADELNVLLPDYHFVPVFYLGSEDADLDELNHIHLMGEKLSWETDQQGAVGRMIVDDELLRLIDRQSQLLSSFPYGSEWVESIRSSYLKNSTLAESTFRLLHGLFAARGLIVLQPDQTSLKKLMQSIFWEELTNARSATCVESDTARLRELGYHPQAHARPINLFYLNDGLRARIEKTETGWGVVNQAKRWNEIELRTELSEHPERFSPNVILRGVYQETILPNLVYVGGGGELAYWLQLKQVFHAYAVPFPLLQLRASVQWMEAHSVHRMESLTITPEQLFQSSETILKDKLDQETRARLDLSDVVSALTDRYESLSDRAASVDPTLKAHVEALRVKAIQKVEALGKKMTRAQRRKMSDLQMQIESLQRAVFPGNGLQERWENPGFYYARYGRAYFDRIYDRIDPFDVSFYWMLESMDQSN